MTTSTLIAIVFGVMLIISIIFNLRYRITNHTVKFMKQNQVNLILMDVKMTVMDGLHTTSNIREVNINIPIIALTANAFDTDRQETPDGGFNHFITKPVSKNKILMAIFRLLRD